MTVTLKDIAKITGYSISTVSRALNDVDGGKKPSMQTCSTILKVAQELGYVANQTARELIGTTDQAISTKTRTIGIVLSCGGETFANQIYGDMLTRLQNHILAEGFSLKFSIVITSGNEKKMFNKIKNTPVSGIIIMGQLTEEILATIRSVNNNLLYVGVNSLNCDIDEVICDAVECVDLIIEHFDNLGCNKIGYIGKLPEDDVDLINRYVRYYAFIDALSYYGHEVIEDYIHDSSFNCETGYSAMINIIQNKPGELPDAVFCESDAVAIGALRALHDNNIMVPGQIKVASIDNISVAEFIHPSLTTVHIFTESLSQLAINTITDKILTNRKNHVSLQVPCQLMVRETTQA